MLLQKLFAGREYGEEWDLFGESGILLFCFVSKGNEKEGVSGKKGF